MPLQHRSVHELGRSSRYLDCSRSAVHDFRECLVQLLEAMPRRYTQEMEIIRTGTPWKVERFGGGLT